MFYGKNKTYGERGRIPQRFCEKVTEKRGELTRAHALLLVNRGRTEMVIKDTMGISRVTVSNIKKDTVKKDHD